MKRLLSSGHRFQFNQNSKVWCIIDSIGKFKIDKKFSSNLFFNMNPLSAYFVYQSHNPGKLTFVNVSFWVERVSVQATVCIILHFIFNL